MPRVVWCGKPIEYSLNMFHIYEATVGDLLPVQNPMYVAIKWSK